MSDQLDFDADLARLEQIRRAQQSARPTQENPAWMNAHADSDFLLGFIDKLWREYTKTLERADSTIATRTGTDTSRVATRAEVVADPSQSPKPSATAVLSAYARAMQAAGVPHEPLQVYDSNSYRRVGLASQYREVMAPMVARDGQPDIRGADVLVAMVAAFNAMLEVRPS